MTHRLSGPGEVVGMLPHLLNFHPVPGDIVAVFVDGGQVLVTARFDDVDQYGGIVDQIRNHSRTAEPIVVAYASTGPKIRVTSYPDALAVVAVVGDNFLHLNNPDAQWQPIPTPAAATAVAVDGSAPMASRDALAASVKPKTPTTVDRMRAQSVADIVSRDSAWIDLDHLPTDKLQVALVHWQSVATHAGADAAPAYFLAAWAAWRLGNGAHASVLLDQLDNLDPTYSAATMLRAVLAAGVDPKSIPALDRPEVAS